MINSILLIPILVSFLITLVLIPDWIKRAKKARLVGKDIQKVSKTEVAEAGGVTVIAGFTLGVLVYIAVNTFVFGTTNSNLVKIFALMSTILLIAFVAFIDDIAGWKIGLRRRTRIILVAFAAIPLIAINAGKSSVVFPFLGHVELGLIYPLIFIPIGIIGATTTFNLLAGFNGLEAGQGIILLSAFSIVAFATGTSWLSVIGLCMIVSLLAFLSFNFSPAKVFPGDILTYSVGGLLAAMAILGNFERIAVFLFIPYGIETILKLRGKLVKESFGKINKDGSLGLKYNKIYSLNHLAIYLWSKTRYKATEVKAVASIWIFQIAIVILGFIIFKGGIF